MGASFEFVAPYAREQGRRDGSRGRFNSAGYEPQYAPTVHSTQLELFYIGKLSAKVILHPDPFLRKITL